MTHTGEESFKYGDKYWEMRDKSFEGIECRQQFRFNH